MSRTAQGRPALLDVSACATCRTMVTQLIEKERIRTTLAKAKTLQRYADHIVTLGKQVRSGARAALCPLWSEWMDVHMLQGTCGGQYWLANAAMGLRTETVRYAGVYVWGVGWGFPPHQGFDSRPTPLPQ